MSRQYMKYAIDEFRVGSWERLGHRQIDLFDEWAEADKFINRLLNYFPLRQFRIVEIKEDKPSEPVLPEPSRSSHHSS